MLSTTSKSWSSTSLSGFWLKLPTVWVMPSWMAPLRAEDVVWGSQAKRVELYTKNNDSRSEINHGEVLKDSHLFVRGLPSGINSSMPNCFFHILGHTGAWTLKGKKQKKKQSRSRNYGSRSKEEEINHASAGNFKTMCGNDAARQHVFLEEINCPTSAATFFRASGESGWVGDKLARSSHEQKKKKGETKLIGAGMHHCQTTQPDSASTRP